METFSALLAICAVSGEFPAQRPVRRRFHVFFHLRPNKRLSKQLWGWGFETHSPPLWRHSNEHANSAMTIWSQELNYTTCVLLYSHQTCSLRMRSGSAIRCSIFRQWSCRFTAIKPHDIWFTSHMKKNTQFIYLCESIIMYEDITYSSLHMELIHIHICCHHTLLMSCHQKPYLIQAVSHSGETIKYCAIWYFFAVKLDQRSGW